MIRPTKYMDLQTNILSVSAEIIVELLKVRVVSLQELDELVQDRLGEKVRTNFVSALNLLFLIGCIEYDNNSDAIYYLSEVGGKQ